MADYNVNIFIDGDKQAKIEGAGLAGEIKEIDGKKAVQVGVSQKEFKKLSKSFSDISVDSSNCFTLPPEAEDIIIGFIEQMKTTDIMKAAIMKLYNPVAGKAIRSKMH